jgi:hypothetical protein
VPLPAPVAEVYTLLERLFAEQCLPLDEPAVPQADDADAAEPPVSVRLREKGEVTAVSLQTPHDPDATYGHKGTGYTATLCETVGNDEKPELITHLALTTATAADQWQTLPTVTALQDRKIQPTELLADASFGSTENLLQCREHGTTLVAPVTGGAGPMADRPQMYVQCFPEGLPSACSLGVLADETILHQTAKHTYYRVYFSAVACAHCPHAAVCPTVRQADGRRRCCVEQVDAVNTLRRFLETTPAFTERYRWRSGIEATNSECKRAHDLGHLRVRGWTAVRLAVYLKGLACNVKRALHYWQRQAMQDGAVRARVFACDRTCGHGYGVPHSVVAVWTGVIAGLLPAVVTAA